MDKIQENIADGQEMANRGLDLFLKYGLDAISAIAILIAGWMIGKWISNKIASNKKMDQTLSGFIGKIARYGVVALTVLMVLGQFGIETASLLAVLGTAGLAIGLALQGTLGNVAAGVFLLFVRPFNVGDFITAGGVSGTVKNLGLFGTELATGDNVFIYVPNSQLTSGDIQNFSRNKTRRVDFVVGISYDDDMDKAMKTIEAVIKNDKRVLKSKGKEHVIKVSNLGDFTVDITVRVWCAASDYWGVKFDFTKGFKEAFDKNGISFPFPTSTVEMLPAKDEAPAPKKKAATKKKVA